MSGLGDDGMAGIARDLRERGKRRIPLGIGIDPARENHHWPVAEGMRIGLPFRAQPGEQGTFVLGACHDHLDRNRVRI